MAGKDYKLTLVMIGPKNVGKTVFLSALANSPGIGIGDPASVRAIKLHWEALSKGELPSATAATLTSLLFSYSGKIGENSYNVDLRIPDYDGHFAEIMSEYETGAREIGDLRALIKQADGFVVFMPADSRDAATMEKLRVEIGSFIDFVRAEYGDSARIERPLVIAVNKWDMSPYFRSAGEDEAARAHVESVGIYRDIYKKLQSYFSDIVILPISAYGHPAQDGKPGPEGLDPYRVEEPIAVIIDKCFSALKKEAGDLETAGNWTGLARLLLRTRALWRRCPAFDYGPLLQKALDHCDAALATRLAGAPNATEYDRIWKESPEKDFWAEYTSIQRAAIEDLKKHSLTATSRDLAQKLAAAKDSAEFEQILQNAPEGRYFADLDREQRADILKLKARHEKGEHRRKNFKKAWFALLVLVIAACGYCGYWYAAFARNHAEAMNPGLGPARQWHALAEFITRYEANPVASALFSGNLREASARRAALVKDVASDIEKRLAETHENSDPCARAQAAGLLLAEANAPGLNAPHGLLNDIELLESRSKRICEARSRIENAKNTADIRAAEALLANLPRDGELAALREALRDRSIEVARAEETSPEKARLDALRAEYRRLRRQNNIAEAEEFINAHQNDPSEEARNMAEDIRLGMGERFYHALLGLARAVENFGEAELGPLREMAANNSGYGLSEAQRENIANELQKQAEIHDREAITGISERITSQNELEDMEERLKAAMRFPATTRLGDNLFRYRRPEDLRQLLAERAQGLDNYRKILTSGLQIRDFEVAATEGNTLDLHGRKLGSAFTRNNELVIRFPGGMGEEVSYKTTAMTEHEEDNGKTYFLNFGPLVIRPVSGEVVLREENFGSSDLGCASPLDIGASDLFNILNSGIWRKPLEGSCRGITFVFHK